MTSFGTSRQYTPASSLLVNQTKKVEVPSEKSVGKIGEYYRRVIWRRLGMTLKLRDRVYEVSGTDPVKLAIMDAELIVSPTNA